MNIIFIIPGPLYDITSSNFTLRYRYLSEFISGDIFTTFNKEDDVKINNFVCHTCKYGDGIYSTIRFVLFCIKQAICGLRNGIKIDAVVTYDPLKTGIIGYVLKKITGAKLIVEVNGVYDSPYVWEGSRDRVSVGLKKWLFPLVIKFVLSRADGIKLLFEKQLAGLSISTTGKIVASYFDWVNTELFNNLGEKKEILFVGFPFRIKGVDILIKAFKQIAGKYPDWHLKILGWYPDMSELDAAMASHPQIFHHPPVSGSEMPKHIGQCGFLVLPSRTEAMGRVLIEAMAAGKARIGTKVGGIPTVINDGVDGLLVEPEDVDDLARKMDLLMGDTNLRNQLGAAAALRAKSDFAAKNYLQETLKFYRQVVGN